MHIYTYYFPVYLEKFFNNKYTKRRFISGKKKQDFKNKKFYYRRANWENQGKNNLQNLLEEAHKELDTVGKRTFKLSTGTEIRGANFKENNGFYLQIASYVPGEATSIIDKDKSAKVSNVTAHKAPEGNDYLDGDLFVYVKGNHVILCPSGARESVAATYILQVLNLCNQKEIAKTFELDKVAQASKLKMIQDEGVKEVELETSLYEASLIQLDKENPKISILKRAVTDQLIAIFGKDRDLKEIKEKENLNLKLSIKFDGKEARRHLKEPEFGEIGRKRLTKTAEQVIRDFEMSNDNGFVIITGSNNKITSEEIRVSDTLRVKTLGKSLSKDAAWEKLNEYYERLNTDGVLNQ